MHIQSDFQFARVCYGNKFSINVIFLYNSIRLDYEQYGHLLATTWRATALRSFCRDYIYPLMDLLFDN